MPVYFEDGAALIILQCVGIRQEEKRAASDRWKIKQKNRLLYVNGIIDFSNMERRREMERGLYDEIIRCLTAHFQAGEYYPADVVIRQLLLDGYAPKRYGYQNMREMFDDLNQVLTLKPESDGKYYVAITAGAQQRLSFAAYKSPAQTGKHRTYRGDGEIGLLSGKTLEEPRAETKPAQPQPAREPQLLSEEQKRQIYTAIALGLELEKPFFISAVSPVLHCAGIDHEKLGFLKAKSMLKCCGEFIDFKEQVMNGVPQTQVTVHHVPQWDEALAGQSRCSAGNKLDDEEKKRIYETLCAHMQVGQPLHMAAFCPILKTYGFDYKRYGYQKVKDMAKDLSDFLTQDEVIMNGVPQTLVTLKPYEKKEPAEDVLQEPSSEKPLPSEEKTKQSLSQIASLPPKILSILSRMTCVPVWGCEKALEESYLAARESGKLTAEYKRVTRRGSVSEDKELVMRFPLTIETMRGDALVGELHKADENSQKQWYLAWVGSELSPAASAEPSKEAPEKIEKSLLTPELTDCCMLSTNVIRAFAFRTFSKDEDGARRIIIEDYREAYAKDTIVVNEKSVSFPLRIKDENENQQFVFLELNRYSGLPLYIRYIGAKQEEKNEAESEKMQQQPALQEHFFGAFFDMVYLPAQVVNLLAFVCGILPQDAIRLLSESYEQRRRARELAISADEMRFVLNRSSLKGEPLTASCRRSRTRFRWFLAAVERGPAQTRSSADERTPLEQFAFFGNREQAFRSLAQLAVPEEWDFDRSGENKLLRRFLSGNFVRAKKQDKIVFEGENAAFHTGLYHRAGFDIYALFRKNLPGSKLPWRFDCFTTNRGDMPLSLPQPVSYFEVGQQLWFDLGRGVAKLELPLVEKGIRSLPKRFLYRYSEAIECSVIGRMQADPAYEDGCYAQLSAHYARRSGQLLLMLEALEKAVDTALKRAEKDYLYVLPGYLPKEDRTVWLLPLALQEGGRPDTALACGDAGQTAPYAPIRLLTMREAYEAMRYIRRMEDIWCRRDMVFARPSAIEGKKEPEK